jgi:uncharacterized protein
MTFDQLMAEPQHLLLKCISGSQAYNLALPTSDIDIKGIFVLPQSEFYGMTYTPQVANASNDEVFYEVGRFIDLLCKNNPNILELLSTPRDCILYRHPLMDLIKPEAFLSRLCLDSFAGYAKTQIKKARGLNKKINRSFDKARKSVLDFCYVVRQRGTVSLGEWLADRQIRQEDCGLSALTHFRDAYQLYHGESGAFRGIVSDLAANDVQLSSIPVELAPLAVLHFNKDAYSIYCREYKEYWEWVEERNDVRYRSTLSHGQNYDAKNMMHTFRLLNMAEEIARYRSVKVYREDRDFLLRIREGEFSFEDLMKQVEEKMEQIEGLFAASNLPDAPNVDAAEELLVTIRREFYVIAQAK